MAKTDILFINGSPNKNGNTVRLANIALKGLEYTRIDLVDCTLGTYGQTLEGDRFEEIYNAMTKADKIILGSPVYWYTMSASMKILFDKIYDKIYDGDLNGKKVYGLIQGSGPTEETVYLMNYTFTRLAVLYGMKFEGIAWNAEEAAALNTLIG